MSDMQEFIDEPKMPHQCYRYLDNDHRCESTAMTGDYFCHEHRLTPTPIIRLPLGGFTLPDLLDRDSIQRAVSEVADRIAGNALDNKRAGLLLFAIQIASSNLPPHPRTPVADEAAKPAAERDEAAKPAAERDEAAKPASEPDEQHSAPCAPILPVSSVILTLNEVKGKNPRISPESPTSAPPTATARTVPTSQSTTLPTLQAVASPQPFPNPSFWRSQNLRIHPASCLPSGLGQPTTHNMQLTTRTSPPHPDFPVNLK